LTGTPTPQPATSSLPIGTRPGHARSIKTARRSGAAVRMVLLVAFTGALVATVVATIFAGLVIAINGRLP
jgi:hypothetical protein